MPLMTQTLPTIVGAGVVSRATDTMFGRRGSGSSRKKASRAKPKGKAGSLKIHKGPRGGRYILRKGRKVYI